MRMSGKARLDLFQIRGRRRLLSSESTIFGLLGRGEQTVDYIPESKLWLVVTLAQDVEKKKAEPRLRTFS